MSVGRERSFLLCLTWQVRDGVPADATARTLAWIVAQQVWDTSSSVRVLLLLHDAPGAHAAIASACETHANANVAAGVRVSVTARALPASVAACIDTTHAHARTFSPPCATAVLVNGDVARILPLRVGAVRRAVQAMERARCSCVVGDDDAEVAQSADELRLTTLARAHAHAAVVRAFSKCGVVALDTTRAASIAAPSAPASALCGVLPRHSFHRPFAPYGKRHAYVVYVYHEGELREKNADPAFAQVNLRFFLEHALDDPSADVVVVVNGTRCSVTVPPHVRLMFRENRGIDFGAWGHALAHCAANDAYERFVFLNDTSRGPFLPRYVTHRAWVAAFTALLNERVRLTGASLNSMVGHPSAPLPHVQTNAWCTDKRGLALLRAAHIFDCDAAPRSQTEKWRLIVAHEIRASRVMCSHGFAIDAHQLSAGSSAHPMADCHNGANRYSGGTLNPAEIIFIKTNKINDVYVRNYTRWTDAAAREAAANTRSAEMAAATRIYVALNTIAAKTPQPPHDDVRARLHGP